MINDEIEKNIGLKKINQAKTNKPFKLGLRSQTHNPLNHKHRLSQEAQFSINLMLICQSIPLKNNK
jgi:hypothetical protein